MHIGIDARMYGVYHRGIGRYVERLIAQLADRTDDNRYTLFMDSKTAESVSFPRGKVRVVRTDAPWYGFREHIEMPLLIRRSGVDVCHFPHLNVPYWCPVPYAVTIHDLIVLHFPDSRATTLPGWRYRAKLAGYRMVLKNALKNAARVMAVSEFTKRDIIRHFGISEDAIMVTYPGVDRMVLGTEGMGNTPQFDAYLRTTFGISRSYLLYVGSAYPHKNLEALISCYVLLRTAMHRNWQLVFAGREDAFYRRLKAFVERAVPEEFRRDIIFTGGVSERDLDGLYRGAKLFVFPSLYEGFGLPPLEAMARGTPVVAANVASIPEALADAASYFEPKSADRMAETLDAVGGSQRLQNELRLRGFERVGHFTWEKTARETLKVLESIRQ